MKRDVVRQVANVVATVGTVVVNALANSLPLNGLTTGEISDRFDVYFVPAGYVFSIWSVIYLGLLAFTIYQALPSQRENPILRRMGFAYVFASVANVIWLFLWHYEVFSLTLLLMLILLGCLIVAYLRIGVGKKRVSTADLWLIHIPFSIYLGWITVATVANATSLLDFIGWGGWGISEQIWAMLMLIAAGAIATMVSLTRGDIAYIAVIVWAFVGIAVKHWGVALVSVPALVIAVLVALTLLMGVPRRAKRYV